MRHAKSTQNTTKNTSNARKTIQSLQTGNKKRNGKKGEKIIKSS